MSAFKGTPGPWTCTKAGFERCDEGEVSYFVGMVDPAISLANCRLIAAAPELLEACQKFSDLFGSLWDTVNPEGGGFLSPESVERYDAIHAEMVAVIAKATGGAA